MLDSFDNAISESELVTLTLDPVTPVESPISHEASSSTLNSASCSLGNIAECTLDNTGPGFC